MPSSSSSTSTRSARGDAKNRAGHKKHKKHKKAKRQKKEAKQNDKQRRRVERAETWECDRADAKRLLGQLVNLDAEITSELEGVFNAIDEGETVHIDSLENKHVRKKLRHLFQALRLSPIEGQGFRTASSKVSFTALFWSLVRGAQAARASTPQSGGEPNVQTAVATPVDKPCGKGTVGALVTKPSGETAETLATHDCIPETELDLSYKAVQPTRQRVVGPQLPTPAVGCAADAAALYNDVECNEDGGGGPQLEGAERRGVDLDSLEATSKREAWMTQPHESIAAAFGDFTGKTPKPADRFAVKRTREEQEEFERLMKARGPSLLHQTLEGRYIGAQEAAAGVRKPGDGGQDLWGMSSREQDRQIGRAHV